MNAQVKEFPLETEDPIIFNEATESVTLGGKPYPLKRLTIKRGREWRQGLMALLGAQQKAQDAPDGLQLELTDEIIGQLSEIVSGYIENLSKEFLEETADDQELIEAFLAIMRHARIPFEKLGQA